MPLRLSILPHPDQARPMVWLQLVRTHTKIVRRMEQLCAQHGLTLPQFDVLATLSVGEGIAQRELAERLLVTKGNVTGVLDRMEKNKWVERREDTSDRRTNRLFLTAAGRQLLATLMPEHHAMLSRVTRLLSTSQMQALYQSLDAMEHALDQEPPRTAPCTP